MIQKDILKRITDYVDECIEFKRFNYLSTDKEKYIVLNHYPGWVADMPETYIPDKYLKAVVNYLNDKGYNASFGHNGYCAHGTFSFILLNN